jgi:hypothetical protein
VRVRTLLLYLLGSRQAILDLAANRRALWVGLVFVVSAGFARGYDSHDLLREPLRVLAPLTESLPASLALFVIACGGVFWRAPRPRFFAAYRSFLTLFWMTAPLAWLYAIPYGRFLPEREATIANLWTLALVVTWRVLLMVRVISVLTGRGAVPCFFLVMALAVAVALPAVFFAPQPAISLLGARQTDTERMVAGVTLVVLFVGTLSAPVWGVGGLVALVTGRARWRVPTDVAGPAPVSRPVRALAVASLVVWVPLLWWTQGGQALGARVERDMRAGRIAEGLDVMSAHARSDCPPYWDPPPRVGYDENTPHILDVMDVLLGRNCAPWVRDEYVAKFRRYLGTQYSYYSWSHGAELPRVVRILRQLPEGPSIAAVFGEAVRSRLADPVNLSAEQQKNFQALLDLAARR